MLAVSTVMAVLIVVAWFPASDLLRQRQQLASATSQLNAVRRSNEALAKEAKRLQTPAEVGRIAAEQDGLVAPGQQSYEVLPASSATSTGGSAPAGTGTGLTKTKGSSSPSGPPTGAASHGAAGAAGAAGATGASRRTGAAAPAPGFFGRVLHTLEFWR
jgi:cell division protein FtsB